jgi:integrase/recombinase XerD
MTTPLVRRNGIAPSKKRAIMRQKAVAPVAERLPEYLLPAQVEALMQQAPNSQAEHLMLTQWRAGLRVSEALALEVADLDYGAQGSNATLRVRRGKGNKPRFVPMHPELAAGLRTYTRALNIRRGKVFTTTRSTAWRWVQASLERAKQLNQIPHDKEAGTHVLRHSAARHWLSCGVPINAVSLWLGHSDIQTTLIYLRLLPDPQGFMDRVL